MLRNFRNNRWQSVLSLIVIALLFQSQALALDDKNNNSKSSSTEKREVDPMELLRRVEQAEATVAEARSAAAAAGARAADLEKRVEEMRLKLAEANKELELVKAQSPSATQEKGVAQEETPPSEEKPQAEALDMLNERITQMEEQADLNKSRLVEFGQTRVETGEKFYVRLFGTLLFNSYYNTAGTFDAPTGLYLFSGNNRNLENGSNFGATIRQTILGFAFKAPTVGQWKLSGDLQLDFFGGNPPIYNGRAFSPLRLRIARARIQHIDKTGAPGRFAVVVGQDDPNHLPAQSQLARTGRLPCLCRIRQSLVLDPAGKSYISFNLSQEREAYFRGAVYCRPLAGLSIATSSSRPDRMLESAGECLPSRLD
jgi:hypothetical protein